MLLKLLGNSFDPRAAGGAALFNAIVNDPGTDDPGNAGKRMFLVLRLLLLLGNNYDHAGNALVTAAAAPYSINVGSTALGTAVDASRETACVWTFACSWECQF